MDSLLECVVPDQWIENMGIAFGPYVVHTDTCPRETSLGENFEHFLHWPDPPVILESLSLPRPIVELSTHGAKSAAACMLQRDALGAPTVAYYYCVPYLEGDAACRQASATIRRTHGDGAK